jgi:hypothetical protein
MAPGQILSVLAGDAGTAGQVSDFKIKKISVDLCLHGFFSLIVHRCALYQRRGGSVNTGPKNQPGLLPCQTCQHVIIETARDTFFGINMKLE